MNLDQQRELITLFRQYQETDSGIIKANLRRYIDKSKHKSAAIAEQTGISIHTINQLRKTSANNYRPDFITTIILCDILNISITAALEPTPGLEVITQKLVNTKWDTLAKRKFIVDYNNLDITALCQKYSITPRTAQEYNKNFVREFEW